MNKNTYMYIFDQFVFENCCIEIEIWIQILRQQITCRLKVWAMKWMFIYLPLLGSLETSKGIKFFWKFNQRTTIIDQLIGI